MTPTVLIAAPVRNRAKHLPHYLKALQALDYPPDLLSYYFLVNDSTDESESLVRSFSALRMTIEVKNLGTKPDARTGSARVTGGVYQSLAILRNKVLDQFEASGAEYLLSVDTDIYVRPSLLKRLLSHQKDMVAALISNRPNRMCPNAIIYKKGPIGRLIPHRFEVPPQPGVYEVDMTGAVCLHSRRVLGCRYACDRAGEDVPFCRQVKAKGLSIWLDTAHLADHHMGTP